MKRCLDCKRILKLIKGKRFHYKESGYDNIYLDGVRQYKCRGCGESGAWIPNIQDLDTLIAITLLGEQNTLEKDDVHYLDISNDKVCTCIKQFRDTPKQNHPIIFRWTGTKWERTWLSIEMKQHFDMLNRHNKN